MKEISSGLEMYGKMYFTMYQSSEALWGIFIEHELLLVLGCLRG